jgi:hypothetical protein
MDRVMAAVADSQARLRDIESEHCYFTHAIASRLFGEMSWEAAKDALHKAQSDPDARTLCAVPFHYGIVFDRDDALAIILLHRQLAHGAREAARMLQYIESAKSDSVMGCKEEFQVNINGAYQHYMQGIKNSSCLHCLAQLGAMLVRTGSERTRKRVSGRLKSDVPREAQSTCSSLVNVRSP